jgi:regulator of protease activity HflC (stomatin/prohibitin superfamily)
MRRIYMVTRRSNFDDGDFVRESRQSIKDRSAKRLGRLIVGGVLLVLLVVLAAASTVGVPARNVGVVTTFGKIDPKPLDSGLHFKKPWAKVNIMDGWNQQINNEPNYKADGEDKAVDARTVVRLDNSSLMFVENNLRWKINLAAAPALYEDWKEFKNIQPGLVEKELKIALNDALSDYDPLNVSATKPTNEQLSAKVQVLLDKRIGAQSKDQKIEIVSFGIVKVDFDDKTQNSIEDVKRATAETKTETQNVKTAQQRALQNKALAQSVKDPGVNISKCLDLVSKAQPGQLPAGFSCFGGSGTQVVTESNPK